MKLKSNNRNVVIAFVMLIGLFAAALAGSTGARNSHGDNKKRVSSELSAAPQIAASDAAQANKVRSITNTEAVAEGLGPIDPHVIASAGGTSSGGGFDLDGTLGELSAGETLSGGPFSLAGGFCLDGSDSR